MATAVNRYRLPIERNDQTIIDRSTSPAHFGQLKNAIDITAPVGTAVLAAADGVVTFVRDDSDSGGPTPDRWHESNFVVIAHANLEFSRYDHLQHRSAKVKVGQHVKAGQPIARVGMTGYTFLPHLHFQVFVFTGMNLLTDFETLAVPSFVND